MKNWFAVIVLSITGCDVNQHPVDRMFDDYLQRVANVQQQDPLPLPTNTIVKLPSKRMLSLPIEPITLGLLDSYELRKCGLFHIIAEKNSLLGKVQDQFRNFEYQLTLLQGLQGCITNPKISPDLKHTLTAIYQEKQSQLPQYAANLLFTSQAMRRQLASNQWIDPKARILDSHLLAAYKQLKIAIMQNKNDPKIPSLNQYQEVFEKVNTTGQLWYSLVNSTNKLNTINKQLQRYDNNIVCQSGRDTTRFRYLNNVFNQTFAANIQTYLARLDAHYFALLPYIQMLETTHPDYQYPITKAHQDFRLATRNHVNYWQRLFKRCGVTFSR